MKSSLILLSFLTTLPALADINLTDADLQGAYSTRSYSKRIVCHDPSVVIDSIGHPKDNPQYLIYGSHLGAGYTTEGLNYKQWTTFGGGESGSCTLFCDKNGTRLSYANAYNTPIITSVKNVNGEMVPFGNFNAHNWQAANNRVQGMQWAPDVIWNPTMQKWLMYMSVNGGLVDITVQYEKSGKVTMSSTTTTQSGKVYDYSYWQSSITAAQIGIFFTIEKAYISSVGPNGESLGIQEVQSDEAPLHEGIYDLYGRPMDQLRPGLNIVNGRKVIIR